MAETAVDGRGLAHDLRIALLLLVGTTAIFGAFGAAIGYGLGRFNPGHYRTVYRQGLEPGFDPVAIGVGHGLEQGTAGGVVVGVALIALLCWRETRLQRTSGTSTSPDLPTSRARLLLLLSGSLLGLGICCGGGCVMGEYRGKFALFAEHRRVIEPVLASDPAFKDVHIEDGRSGTGRMSLYGHVATQADLSRLQERITAVIGDERAKSAVKFVEVKPDAAEPRVDPKRQAS